tara:strand:- start:535 stop:870 length:336 start_codon:yes stop_codon:yes gene_type:complete
MENISAEQIKKFLEHQNSVRRASAKYYAKKNRKDYKDPKTGELFEFSKSEYNEDQDKELNDIKQKRKEYHAKRYKEKAEYIKNQTKEYRLRKKQEKTKNQQPLLLNDPVSV